MVMIEQCCGSVKTESPGVCPAKRMLQSVLVVLFRLIGQVNEPGWSTYRQLLERFSVEVCSDARNGSTSLRL